MLSGHEDDEIMLYCTGGVRCEKASAYLIKQGFNKVSQLSGGVIQYAHDIKTKGIESKFLGKNFVFDDRMGEPITNDVIECVTNVKDRLTVILIAAMMQPYTFIQCDRCLNTLGAALMNVKTLQAFPLKSRKNYAKILIVWFQVKVFQSVKPKLKEAIQ